MSAEDVGKVIAGMAFWAFALMAFAMIFSASWNRVAFGRFGMPLLDSLDSLSALLCLWIAGRVSGLYHRSET